MSCSCNPPTWMMRGLYFLVNKYTTAYSTDTDLSKIILSFQQRNIYSHEKINLLIYNNECNTSDIIYLLYGS